MHCSVHVPFNAQVGLWPVRIWVGQWSSKKRSCTTEFFSSLRTNVFLLEEKICRSLQQSASLQLYWNSLESSDRSNSFAQKDPPSYWKALYLDQNILWQLMLGTRHYACFRPQHLHERHCDHGVEYLWAFAQQIFSILKLRMTLRSIQLKCVSCWKRKVETFTPNIANVPRKWLSFRSTPFSNTGID